MPHSLDEVADKSWLPDDVASPFIPERVWYVLSNLVGILLLPVLAIFGWSIDLYMAIRGMRGDFRIADVRGLLIWHLRAARPYNHLRMIEHALALNMVKRVVKDKSIPIVDLGAEKSLFASYLARLGYRVTALDLDGSQMVWQRELLARHQKSFKYQMEFIIGSITDLPLADDSCHVLAISVIEHIEDDMRAFQEIGRVIGDRHEAIISFLYQDTPVSDMHRKAAWARAREYHPAYGHSRDPQEHILLPSGCNFEEENYFWKKFCRRAKGISKAIRILKHSIIFDYFVLVRLARLEGVVFPGKQANDFAGTSQAFQWIFRIKKSH
ncbi:class I SAM-dependent methyltransferase [Gemmatimonas aurantiaca]|nr:class I SAM-dependent methyltransferase [Gemmatimonas aurantiaca]